MTILTHILAALAGAVITTFVIGAMVLAADYDRQSEKL